MITTQERITDYDQKFNYTKNFLNNYSLKQFKELGENINQLPDWMSYEDWKTFVDSYIKTLS